MSYQFGDVVLVEEVVDPQGKHAKCRPAVILEMGDALFGAAITTQFGNPLEKHEVLVFDGKMSNRTGLTKASVANLNWLFAFHETQIIRKLGHVLPDHLRVIRAYLSNRPKS